MPLPILSGPPSDRDALNARTARSLGPASEDERIDLDLDARAEASAR